jgi:hypothetical protein
MPHEQQEFMRQGNVTSVHTGHHLSHSAHRSDRHSGNGVAHHERNESRTRSHDHSNKVGHRDDYGHQRSHHADHSRGARLFHHAAARRLEQRFAPSIDISKSVSFSSSEPAEARDAAKSLLAAANAVLVQAGGSPAAVATEIRDSLAQARTEANQLTTTQAQAQGVADTAALVDEGLEIPIAQAEDSGSTQAQVLAALKARRRQAYSLQIRTQEGDLVKISLRTSESLRITDTHSDPYAAATEADSGQDISLRANARLNLRVYGDLNETELEAIRGVFEQAADVAEQFLDGDLASALESANSLQFESAQIAKIRLSFRSRTSVSALYTPAPPPPIDEPAVTAEVPPVAADPAQTPVTADAADTPVAADAQAVADTQAAADAPISADPVAVPTVKDGTGTDSSANGALNGFADAISSYFRSLVEGLETLQANSSESPDENYRRVTAFKLDVLKVTLLASAGEDHAGAAEQAAEAIEDAATSQA